MTDERERTPPGCPIEIRLDEDGVLDEVVAKGASVHLEYMGDHEPEYDTPSGWWLGIRVGDHSVHVNLWADANIRGRAEYEHDPIVSRPTNGAMDGGPTGEDAAVDANSGAYVTDWDSGMTLMLGGANAIGARRTRSDSRAAEASSHERSNDPLPVSVAAVGHPHGHRGQRRGD